MAKGFKIEFVPSTVKNTIRAGNAWSQKTRGEIGGLIERYTNLIHDEAQRLAPVDTGELKGSIRTSLKGVASAYAMHGEVIAGSSQTYWAPFNEFGTGQRGAASGVETAAGYNYGSVPGMSAQPFMRPAADKYRDPFLRDLRKILRG